MKGNLAYYLTIGMRQMKDNVARIHDCYGCGVCAAACPHDVINIVLNKAGFYEPMITDEAKCVKCGICLDVCAYSHSSLALEDADIHAWASWSNDVQVRKKCSSGGIGFEIGRQLIAKGYEVVGCRYNADDQRAEHYIASTKEELIQSIGSKYIQSYTEDAFKEIDKKRKYLVTGTPCQIDSFRRMIRRFKCEENFVLMDFYCHCVPSIHAWRNYIKIVEKQIGKVIFASWRNKFEYGWHDSWLMGIDGEKVSQRVDWHDSYNLLIREKKTFVQSRMSQGDWFYKMFLGHYCPGKQCQRACKYKYEKSSADIRIGDLWGKTYSENEEGVSALVAFTAKGKQVIDELENVTLVEHPLEVVAEGQMTSNVQPVPISSLVMFLYSHGIYPTQGQWKVIFRLLERPFRGYAKIKKMVSNIGV